METTRKLQTQLLHYFSKSHNKSNNYYLSAFEAIIQNAICGSCVAHHHEPSGNYAGRHVSLNFMQHIIAYQNIIRHTNIHATSMTYTCFYNDSILSFKISTTYLYISHLIYMSLNSLIIRFMLRRIIIICHLQNSHHNAQYRVCIPRRCTSA